MSSSPSLSRTALVAGLLVLALAGCGRRGALEAPPDPAAVSTEQSAVEGQGTLPSPVGTPRSQPNRGFTIPKDRFILDPLL